MRFVLHDYQHIARDRILSHLRKSQRDYSDPDDGSTAAVCLSAPTGAGKTVICASIVEELLDPDRPSGSVDATFLWVTDDPSLNEQTRRKMLTASNFLSPGQLRTIENDFDEEFFPPGHVYFLNIQKLSSTATLSKTPGDRRSYSLWQTISNTIAQRPKDFYVIVDEAHRGMTLSSDRESIVSRIIGGGGTGRTEVPVVFGITATPDRFVKAMLSGGRALKTHEVPIEQVRASGLLKDQIILYNPIESLSEGDSSVLREAIRATKSYSQRWTSYSASEHEQVVVPLVVVQVGNTPGTQDFEDILETIFDEWNEIQDMNIVNTFADHQRLLVGPHSIRYCKPEEIQDDERVRVVLSKEAITTGWDCPRAEVLISLRAAQDMDHITQIMGRMVRTPLARRVLTDESLNAVSCFLPRFNRAHVEAIADRFRAGEDNLGVGPDTITLPVTTTRNSNVDISVFALAERLPSYVLPSLTYRRQVDRLMSLAVLLEGEHEGAKIEAGALKAAEAMLAHEMATIREGLEAEGRFEPALRNISTVQLDLHVANLTGVAQANETDDTQTSVRVPRDIDGIHAQYRQAASRVGSETVQAHLHYLLDSASGDPGDVTDYMMQVAAVSLQPETVNAVERAASEQVRKWLREHSATIRLLTANEQEKFDRIKREAVEPEETTFTIPVTRIEQQRDTRWPLHLLCDSDGLYPCNLKSWEQGVLEHELQSDTLVAWYRNPTGGDRSLRVPYVIDGGIKPMYPDFLFFHGIGSELVTSIVDPHGYHLSDALPKLKGIAKYAELHGRDFDRVLSVAEVNGSLKSLDLQNHEIRSAIYEYQEDTTLGLFSSSLAEHFS